ncbi:MAG: hypothetical protein K2N94_09670, partial [Lachnospiraceae bacterium]|nr:hypothetical protein [Lachnospiraceae bacterium]
MVTLGGDLGEWILMENRDTGEQGWLKVNGEDWYSTYYAFGCFQIDGAEIDCEDLFADLLGYD